MKKVCLIAGLVFLMAGMTSSVFSYYETMDSPIIKDAQAALNNKNVTPILKWVPVKKEIAVKEAFEKALKDRSKLKDKTDMAFFEFLVRTHQESEGIAYTGIQTAGTRPDPSVVLADESIALKKTGATELAGKIRDRMVKALYDRYFRVMNTKDHMNDSVEAGRAYVNAYRDYVTFIEEVLKPIMHAPKHIDDKYKEWNQ